MGEHSTCLHEERWEGLQRDRADDRKLLLEIHKRLFMDNGTPALMTRVDRIERITNAIAYVLSAVVIAGLIAGLGEIFRAVWAAKGH